MFCPECGTKAEDGAVFCIQCGYNLGTASAKPAAPPPKTVYSSSAVSGVGSEKTVVKKIAVHPAVAASRYSLSSIPMFVLTFMFTVLSVHLTVLGIDFELVVTGVLDLVQELISVEFDTEYLSMISIVVWLVLVVQAYVMCAGLWVTTLCGLRSKGRSMNTAGLRMIHVGSIITLVEVIVLGFAVLAFLGMSISEVSSNIFFSSLQERLQIIFGLCLVFYVLTIIYFAKINGTVSSTICGIVESRFCGDTSMYVIVMSFIFSILGFIFAIEIVGKTLLGTQSFLMVFLFSTIVLFVGISFIRNKTIMDASLKEEASRSLLSGFISH